MTGQEDPIVHFYETFLAAYDPKLRELRGVYYTPEPVVSYIVRSVDILLKEKFGLAEGLADRSTIEVEVEEGGKKVMRPLPKVLILDPACGTGTFLYHVIKLIRERYMLSNNAGEWSDFVRHNLLPRIYGFELLMAPYAVAHLKLAMQLAGQDLDEPLRSQWAYDFAGNERLNIYMTNSLEMTDKTVQMALFGLEKQIAEEANAAHSIKSDLPIMVVMGNPPYNNFGMLNKNDWIMGIVGDYKEGLDETKLNLNDDFIKFFKFAQWRIERTGKGILAFISNNVYLNRTSHRRMRESLLRGFSKIWILDLKGNARIGDRAKDGGVDQNVFDIKQGVAIGLFARGSNQKEIGSVSHAELRGNRRTKEHYLAIESVATTSWQGLKDLEFESCLGKPYFFYPINWDHIDEYCQAWDISKIFPAQGPGVKTERDKISIHFRRNEIEGVVKDFLSLDVPAIRQKYNLDKDSRDWKVSSAIHDLTTSGIRGRFCEIAYRPLDIRHTWYSGTTRGFIGTPNFPIMKHALIRHNLLLGTCCVVETAGSWQHVLCTDGLAHHHSVSMKEGNNFFPLYLSVETERLDSPRARHANLSPQFVKYLAKKLKLKIAEDGSAYGPNWVTPEEIFSYVYAILHSPTYRRRYAEFLKIDFPRVPVTSDLTLFRRLATLGDKMVAVHLMRPNEQAGLHVQISYPVNGDNVVQRVQYSESDHRVYFNKTQYFEGVLPAIWEFHIGGYQVVEQYLKDRKGRPLTVEDREHFRRIVEALSETVLLMKEIDAAIPSWPIE